VRYSMYKDRFGLCSPYSGWATDWKVQGWNPVRAKGFSLALHVQNSFGAHPASCSVGTGWNSFARGAMLTIDLLSHVPSFHR
jgi:hypothetical protein